MKKIIYSFLFVASFLYPQENALALEQKKLLILPAENYEDPNSISSKTTNIIASEAIKLGRFDVIDRSLLDAILAEQKLQLSGLMNEDDIIEVGNLSSAEEALFIKINTFVCFNTHFCYSNNYSTQRYIVCTFYKIFFN